MEKKSTIKKNQVADIPTKNGNKYSYQYVDIAQIHEYLESENMSYYQYIDRIDNDDYIMTVRIINGEEKPPLRGSRVVDATLFGNDNPAQKQGSALTYARRYSLLMAFGLATEDDDANSLNKPAEPTIKTKEEALELEIKFGKYKGNKLKDILDDESYLEWLFDNGKDENIIKAVSLITGWEIKSEEEQKEEVKIVAQYKKLLEDTNTLPNIIPEYYAEKGIEKMGIEEYKKAIKMLEEKKKKQEEK